METKFTKGEWRVKYNGSWYQIVAIEGNNRDWIADTCASSCCGDLALGESNAHLIAAAPDMYEEIEQDANDLLDLLATLDRYSNDYLFYESKLEGKQLLLAQARGEL